MSAERLKSEKRCGMVAYLTAGDPTPDATPGLVAALERGGADLIELGVPFIFASGYGEQASLPLEHRGRPVVQKPYTLENVATALADILG